MLAVNKFGKTTPCLKTPRICSAIKPRPSAVTLQCGAKTPTLGRPTQEGRKAGKGPVRREPPHQHVEDQQASHNGQDLLGYVDTSIGKKSIIIV
ncbi:hypothetical protein AVEN_236374-1 [Araneus ventricosus]|uniref:Uncharacterized protein n=1 Tax=Araneus ventricosus TaxID=182803 RepID=A0A4Y2VVS1_ARAVE|nr:hypothetical protein AVEN_236374-1 [Araneus ventricosus]